METDITKGLTYTIDPEWVFPENYFVVPLKNNAEEVIGEEQKDRDSTRRNKQRFLRNLAGSKGVITYVTELTGISRATYYNWRETDPDFKKEADEIIGAKPGILEDRMFSSALKGDVRALKFMLSHIHPDYKRISKGKSESEVHIYHHVDKKDDSKKKSFADMVWDEAKRRRNLTRELSSEFPRQEFPLKPDGSVIKDEELYKYEQYIRDWFKQKSLERELVEEES